MYYGLEILVEEHDNVIRFKEANRVNSKKIMNGEELSVAYYRKALEFGRGYVDKYHHGKEEKILFDMMIDRLGPLAMKLIRNGMLVEHDMGRLYLKNLEAALDGYEAKANDDDKLDIIVAINEYGELLQRHAYKENDVVYTFAQRSFSEQDGIELDEKTEAFEAEAADKGTKAYYLEQLEELIREA